MTAKLRNSEWILLAYFVYTAAIVPFFQDRPRLHLQPLATLVAVALILWMLAQAEARYPRVIRIVRDWTPLPLTLLAFREMEWFVPSTYNVHYEQAWIRLDQLLLNHYHFKALLDGFAPLLPTYFELCYLLVYGVGTYCVVVLWLKHRREQIDRFYVVLLVGTLLSYSLFPYFPSRPPRIAFPEVAAPVAHDVFRRLNLFLLRSATIHTGVFPSAHVSSAFSAAWAMFAALPERKRYGWGLLFYALSVAVATIYGRYHYAADAIAGVAISLVAAAVAVVEYRRNSARDGHSSGSDAHLVA